MDLGTFWLTRVDAHLDEECRLATYHEDRRLQQLFHDYESIKGLEVYVGMYWLIHDKKTTRKSNAEMLEKFCFVVGPNGIEVDPNKIKAIQDMGPPRTKHQVRSFLGKIQYINRFISRLSITCAPIFKLLKKNQLVKWNEDCQKAFDHIKRYLMNPPVLSSPKPGEPLTLYLSIEDAGVGAMLAQPDAAGVEKAIYYISKKLLPIEEKYTYRGEVTFVSKLILGDISGRTPTLRRASVQMGLIQEWLIQMSSVDAEFVTRKTVKGRVVAEFLAENPVGLGNCIDGSANRSGAEASIVIEAPNGEVIMMCKRLLFPVTNNMAEYEACIMGMEALLAFGAKEVEVIGDSLLVIEHANERWKVEEERLKPYVEYLLKKATLFDKITFTHIGRTYNIEEPYNKIPNALVGVGRKNPWFTDYPAYILRYMKDGTFSNDATKEDRSVFRKMALNYVLVDGELYRRAWDGMLLRCVDKEGEDIMKKIHEGVCGTHLSGISLARKIMRQGYFWTQMEGDCVNYVRHSKTCQHHDNKRHLPAVELHRQFLLSLSLHGVGGSSWHTHSISRNNKLESNRDLYPWTEPYSEKALKEDLNPCLRRQEGKLGTGPRSRSDHIRVLGAKPEFHPVQGDDPSRHTFPHRSGLFQSLQTGKPWCWG
ncbi:uncharacterized protein LOC119371491 [Jatropha curcas]|uniref:uncharacterized protein LOC119371491 n=1 Tax=Jatropha curcas TaxID=180498 RepID=UPI001893178C|nr:uncharacterized protein LOC119371491 [Jatropha curcas]